MTVPARKNILSYLQKKGTPNCTVFYLHFKKLFYLYLKNYLDFYKKLVYYLINILFQIITLGNKTFKQGESK